MSYKKAYDHVRLKFESNFWRISLWVVRHQYVPRFAFYNVVWFYQCIQHCRINRLNSKLNYMTYLNNCYSLVTWEWYSKFPYVWRTISPSKTKLKENYVLYCYIILSVAAAMVNTLVKTNDIIERGPRNILVSHLFREMCQK